MLSFNQKSPVTQSFLARIDRNEWVTGDFWLKERINDSKQKHEVQINRVRKVVSELNSKNLNCTTDNNPWPQGTFHT